MPAKIRPVLLGGHRGLLAPAGGYGLYDCGTGNGAVFFCNHWRFYWHQHGSWYVATLHHFGPQSRQLLGRLLRELRPVRDLH
jgi:hypothetical protein